MKLAITLLVVLGMQGCAYYSYSTKTSYGLTPVDTIEYLGAVDSVGYDSEVFSPVVTLENGVQIKFRIAGLYNYPIENTYSRYFLNLDIEIFITSLDDSVVLDLSDIIINQYRVNKKRKMKFMKLERSPSEAPDEFGIDVCTRAPNWDSYNFYKEKILTIPKRTDNFKQLPLDKLHADKNIICGILHAPDTNLADEQGFFNLYLTFIVDGRPKTYTIYFYPVDYRATIR